MFKPSPYSLHISSNITYNKQELSAFVMQIDTKPVYYVFKAVAIREWGGGWGGGGGHVGSFPSRNKSGEIYRNLKYNYLINS